MRKFPLAFSLFIALIAISAIALTAEARAQTASFSFAITTLGGGFNGPLGVAVDGSGNVYVADYGNSAVKEMPAGCASPSCVTTLVSGFSGPGVAVDRSGNVYVADYINSAVKEMPAGCASSSCVTTLGGGFSYPNDVAVDGSGNVYVADENNSAVKEIPAGCVSSSCVTTLGGGFHYPGGVAVDGSGNVYVADLSNSAVKEMPAGCASSSCVTTLGGGFTNPEGVAVDGSGNVYVADLSNSAVKEMPAGCASSGCVTALGGGFSLPSGVAVDGSGNVYVGDYANSAVKEIMTRGVNFLTVPVKTTSAALTLTFTFNSAGSMGAATPYQVLTQGATNLDFNPATTQESNACSGTTAYTASETCTVDVTFTPQRPGARYGAVELLNATGAVIATGYVQGTGVAPQANFLPGTQSTVGSGLNSPGGIAASGSNVFIANSGAGSVLKETFNGSGYTQTTLPTSGLEAPGGVAADGAGNVYIADYAGNAVYKESPSGTTYTQSTAVTGLNAPTAVAVDADGNLYIVNSGTAQVFKETLANGNYTQTTLGTGLVAPYGIAVDGSGNVFISDPGNTAVFKETWSGVSYTQSSIGSGLEEPEGLAVDGLGNVYISDYGLKQVFKETLTAVNYTQSVVSAAGLIGPAGVAVDAKGDIFIADYLGDKVYEEDLYDPPSLTFATPTIVGTTDTADGPLTVTLQNAGNAALTFPVPSSGNNPSSSANFTFNSSGEGACPLVTSSSSAGTLAAGATCFTPISFKPTAAGSLSGSLVITDTNLNAAGPGYATQTISLSGTGTVVPAALTSPTPGTQLASTSITFSWTPGEGITHYWLNLGTGSSGVNAKNIYSGSSITATSVTASGLPTNGETIYATLYSEINGVFQPTVYTFHATGPAVLTSPAAGTKLTASATFTWTPGTGIAHYWFDLGTADAGANSKNLYNSGSTTALTATVTGIPQYGETLYATLYSYIAGVWQPIYYTFTAGGSPVAAVLTTPAPSTKLASSSVTFTWSAGEGVTYYWFNLGTASSGANSKNLYSGSSTTLTSVTAASLPTNGETLYATLYSYIAGVWQPTYYTYTASGSPTPATLTTPAPSSTLTSSTVTFTWSPGSGVTYFWLNLGTGSSGAGAKNLYAGASTTATSVTVGGLPTNGKTIYATLYSYIGGVWQPTVYTYTAQ